MISILIPTYNAVCLPLIEKVHSQAVALQNAELCCPTVFYIFIYEIFGSFATLLICQSINLNRHIFSFAIFYNKPCSV